MLGLEFIGTTCPHLILGPSQSQAVFFVKYLVKCLLFQIFMQQIRAKAVSDIFIWVLIW